MTDESKLAYIAGYLESTLGSTRKLTAADLKARMRYVVALIEDEPDPAQHLSQRESSETIRATDDGDTIH